jgi:hypothetical protein
VPSGIVPLGIVPLGIGVPCIGTLAGSTANLRSPALSVFTVVARLSAVWLSNAEARTELCVGARVELGAE